MPLVIDVSVMANWHFLDEQSAEADAVLAMLDTESAIVPGIWWFEMRQVMLKGERRGRTTPEQSAQFLNFVTGLPIKVAAFPDQWTVLELSRRHQLTFYDAAYLELAQRETIALATLDQALARAAAAEGVPLIGR